MRSCMKNIKISKNVWAPTLKRVSNYLKMYEQAREEEYQIINDMHEQLYEEEC